MPGEIIMRTEAAELPNLADERVIDACLELIEAGRPVSEIIDSAKRLSTSALAPDYKSAQQPGIAPGTKRLPQSWYFGTAILLVLGGAAAGTAYLPRTPVEPSAVPVASAPIPGSTITTAIPAASGEIEALINRGSMLFGDGDLVGARALYKRAAEAGNARAAMYLASTYDPAFLRQARFGTAVRGDPEASSYWYSRARHSQFGEQLGGDSRPGSASRQKGRVPGAKAGAQSGG
jgi:hypothetical protein